MKRISFISLALLFSIFLAMGMANAADPKEIRVGACESATGMFAGFSAGGMFGLKVAVEDINKQGGVFVKKYNRKLPVKLILVDNQSDPAKAGTLASNLILRDKVHVLINSPGPATVYNPQSIIAERHKIPYIAGEGPMEPWQGARRSADPPWKYTWGFGFCIATPPPPGDFRHGKPGYILAESWFKFLGTFADRTNKTVGAFASDEADGRGWYMNMPKALEKAGYNVIGEEKNLGLFPMGTTDFSAVIKEWKKNNCEILVGNCPGPDFGVLWRQSRAMGFIPKICIAERAANFYEDVSAWGGDLPNGVAVLGLWSPEYPPEHFPGIGETTPMSLSEAWKKKTGKPLNWGIAWGYFPMQVLVNAIERAGTLDGPALNKAIGETDMPTISGRAVFTKEEQHCRLPIFYRQWQKTDKPWKWDEKVIFSEHDFIKVTGTPIFPIPR